MAENTSQQTGAPMLEALELTKRFPAERKGLLGLYSLWERLRGQAEDVTALENVSFEVQRGEIFGLLGPNGAGKTTLCKIINALVAPTSGSLKVNGYDTLLHHTRLARDMVTIFGGEPDLFGLFAARLSVEGNLAFIGDLWGLERTVTQRRLVEALRWLDLEDKRNEWYQKLSGGTRQKLFMAIPLILRRSFVVLDEPTNRLDVPTRKKVQEVIRNVLQAQDGATVLLTTHDMQEAERLCDRIAFIQNGKLEALGTPAELRRKGGGLRARLCLAPNGDPEARRRELEHALTVLRPGVIVELLGQTPDAERGDGLLGLRVKLSVPSGSRLDDQTALMQAVLDATNTCGLTPLHLGLEEPTLEEVFVQWLANRENPAPT